MNTLRLETFKKRPGCTDRGKDYEHLYICTVILKLLSDPTVHDFQISSNDASFGVFDDVIVHVLRTDATRKTYTIQLKHVNKGKTLTKNALCEKRGNFSIKKYHDDYAKLPNTPDPTTFVLSTNLKFDVPDSTKMTLAEDQFEVAVEDATKEELLATGKGRFRRFAAPGTEYERFFGDFVLCTDQASVDELERDARGRFRGMWGGGEGVFERYVQYVTEWSLLEGKKNKLNREMMVNAVVVRAVAADMVPLSFSGGCCSDNGVVLRDAMDGFAVTQVDRLHVEKVARLWSDRRSSVDVSDLNRVNKMYQITSHVTNVDELEDRDCTRLLWLMGLCPLPVFASDTVTKAIAMCQNRFLVFDTTKSSKKTFSSFADLDPSIQSRIGQQFKFSLQGKEDVTLESVLQANPNVLPLITTNQLVQMLDAPLKLGGKKEALPIPHIDRLLSRNLIKMTYLDSPRSSLVIISHVTPPHETTIRNATLDCALTRIQDVWKRKSRDETKNEVVLSAQAVSQAEIEALCRPASAKYHLFRVSGDLLEWQGGTGSVGELKQHQVDGRWVEQSALFAAPATTNVVCADPGMGKSILMRNLKNTSKRWTVLLQPKDHSSYFRRRNSDADAFESYVVDRLYPDDFVRRFVAALLERRQVVFVWDGLDEVAPENLKVIFEIVALLAKRGVVQWLTSRCNLRGTLEAEFNVLARSIDQFDAHQQNMYIEKRLNCSGRALEDIKSKIHKCIRLVQYNDILGIPLQIYMFTELFRQDPDKYRRLLSSVFSITDLYRHFVDEKFNIYHRVKAKLDESNDVMIQVAERSKKDRLRQYEESSLKTYLRPDVVDALRINCDDFLEEIRTTCDSVGIIIDVTDDRVPSFLHNSYGEYFAASFLRKNYSRVPGFADFIFDAGYNNIRFLFDLLMAERCPAHVAVLYKNPGVLLEHEDDLARKDEGGRSPLHLACSWGRRFSGKDDPEAAKDEAPEYQQILAFLTDRCDPLEHDGLFRMDAFAYADVASCLVAILVLSNSHKCDFSLLRNFSDVGTLLYNAVKLDYADVFEDIPFVEGKKPLLQVAVSHGSINTVKKMMLNPEYRARVDVADSNGVTPFLSACHNGCVGIVEVLLASGVDVAAATAGGHTAVYLAARGGHADVLRHLVDSGVDVNARNRFGKTALHLACEETVYKAAELLLEHGADVDFPDDHGYTALYLACRHKQREIVELLLRNGADVNLANHHGDAPLFMAAWSGQVDVMRMLMDRGAGVDVFNKKGHGPVHCACLNRLPEVLRLLIENNVDVDAPNKFGQTPLHLCVRHHFDAGIVMLLQAGADMGAVNKHGETFWEMGERYYKQGVGHFVVQVGGEKHWDEIRIRVGRERVRRVEVADVERNTKRCNIS